MPAILTHDFFGRDVCEDVSQLLSFRSIDETDAFLLGNQGPDPLFYLIVNPAMSDWAKLGNLMHSKRTASLLLAMREACDLLQGRDRAVARAYVAGFACHWQLDSTVHPLVYYWQYGLTSVGVEGLDESSGSYVHAEIERDYDEMVLYAHTGRTVEHYRPHERVLTASQHVLEIIDSLYSYSAQRVYRLAAEPTVYSSGVRAFRLCQAVLDSPEGYKRSIVGGLERAVTGSPYSIVCAMSHRARAEATSDFDNREHYEWANPATGEKSTESFQDIYARASKQALTTVSELILTPDPDLNDVRGICSDTNFSGEPSYPEDEYSW